MTSKYQHKLFPTHRLGRMTKVSYYDSSGILTEDDYKTLKLEIINGQLCFVTSTDNILPIARVTTIQRMWEKENETI